MVRMALLGASLLALTSCISSKQLTLPNGHPGYAIKCDGHLHDMTDCMARAGELCPTGYDVLDGNTEQSQFATGSSFATAGSGRAAAGSTTFAGAMVFRSLMVECHGS
jgi:hypothetical protein